MAPFMTTLRVGPEKIEIYDVTTNETILMLCGSKELRERTARRLLAMSELKERHPGEFDEILDELQR